MRLKLVKYRRGEPSQIANSNNMIRRQSVEGGIYVQSPKFVWFPAKKNFLSSRDALDDASSESKPTTSGLYTGIGTGTFYLIVRAAVFRRFLKSHGHRDAGSELKRSIHDVSKFSSAIISTINASFASVMGLNVFRLKLWKHPVRSDPSILFYSWCALAGYHLRQSSINSPQNSYGPSSRLL